MAAPASFYEVICELPSDVETQLPLVSDSFIQWITGKQWKLPEDAVWDLDQVDQVQLTLGDKIQRDFLRHWRGITQNDNPLYFVQLEQGDSYFHLHLLIECCQVKPLVLGRYVSTIQKKLVSTVYGGHSPQIENWLRITKTKNVGGSNKVRQQDYIPAYLLPKVQPEVQWAWTNIEEYKKAVLNRELRHSLATAHLERQGLSETHPGGLVRNGEGAPIIQSKTTRRYMELVDWLVEKGITSEKQWLLENKESYRSFQATSNAARQIKTALQSAIQEMMLTKTAQDYLIGKELLRDIEENRIFKILKMNNYDPLYVGNIFVGWAQRKYGKRNTLWFFGPATTGKTNIAEAIAHAVPFYGCVNWTNENFPFNDCTDKMIIWWEEGKMTAKIVETAKAILGGSKVRVDQKCKASVQLDPTPVMITSNTNMCYVVDGNTTTFEHAQPLQDRMFKIELTKRLSDDFGKVTKEEVREFFKWASDNPVPVEMEFQVKRGVATRKRSAPEDGEDKSPPAKQSRADAGETLTGEEASTTAPKEYVLRCNVHRGLDPMLYACKKCESLNMPMNQCVLHNKTVCTECFPEYDQTTETPMEEETTGGGWVPCAVHHLMGKPAVHDCSACRLKNVDLDDTVSEQ